MTVIVPTFNGDRYLSELLEATLNQQIDGAVEILVIDSGSTDRTLEIVGNFPRVRLHQIPNADFGHGRTRNLGVSLARGTYVAFLTHDAVPAHSEWLKDLLAPMQADQRVACVMGRQAPRPGCFPLLKYEIGGVFGGAGPAHAVTLYSAASAAGDERALQHASFYSDVNCAARTSVLRDEIPYRDVDYAEDQLFGRDVLEAGYVKAYAGRAVVVHSNDLTLSEYRMRIFDETMALRRIGVPSAQVSLFGAVARAVRGAWHDTVRIARDPEFSWKRRTYWLVVNPLFHVAKWRSLRRAARTSLDDEAATARHSLEAQRRSER